MRNVFKVVSSVGSVALLMSGTAMAAHLTFGNFTVSTGGVITDNTAPCAGAITGQGFEQCQVVINGQTYVRTRIAEGFATAATLSDLTFSSEDFVEIGAGSTQGLASNMSITDATTNPGTTFNTTANVRTGWATTNAGTAGADKSQTTLGLTLNTPGATGAFEGFNSTFNVTAVTDASNNNVISALGVGQTVELGSSTDKQRFELRNIPSAQIIWAAQSVTGTDNFGVTRSIDVATGAVTGTRTSLGSTAVDTTVWTTAFGPVPTF